METKVNPKCTELDEYRLHIHELAKNPEGLLLFEHIYSNVLKLQTKDCKEDNPLYTFFIDTINSAILVFQKENTLKKLLSTYLTIYSKISNIQIKQSIVNIMEETLLRFTQDPQYYPLVLILIYSLLNSMVPYQLIDICNEDLGTMDSVRAACLRVATLCESLNRNPLYIYSTSTIQTGNIILSNLKTYNKIRASLTVKFPLKLEHINSYFKWKEQFSHTKTIRSLYEKPQLIIDHLDDFILHDLEDDIQLKDHDIPSVPHHPITDKFTQILPTPPPKNNLSYYFNPHILISRYEGSPQLKPKNWDEVDKLIAIPLFEELFNIAIQIDPEIQDLESTYRLKLKIGNDPTNLASSIKSLFDQLHSDFTIFKGDVSVLVTKVNDTMATIQSIPMITKDLLKSQQGHLPTFEPPSRPSIPLPSIPQQPPVEFRTKTGWKVGFGKNAAGKFGFRCKQIHGRMVVCKLEPEGSAARAGLRFGDVVTHVNGRNVAGWSPEELGRHLKSGPAEVTLNVTY